MRQGGEAWPLSEDYHLCVHGAAAEVPELGANGNDGIYFVDSLGNKEMIDGGAEACDVPQ